MQAAHNQHSRVILKYVVVIKNIRIANLPRTAKNRTRFYQRPARTLNGSITRRGLYKRCARPRPATPAHYCTTHAAPSRFRRERCVLSTRMTFRICFRVYRLATLLGPLFSWHIRACDTSNASIPLELSARTLDPIFSKSCTVSYCPLYAASWRAVEPHAHRARLVPRSDLDD